MNFYEAFYWKKLLYSFTVAGYLWIAYLAWHGILFLVKALQKLAFFS